MSEHQPPRRIGEIVSYDLHVYFDGPEQRERALLVRQWIADRFLLALNPVRETPIGPHPSPMFSGTFACDRFATLVPWLLLNRQGLNVLIHPNTDNELADHLAQALWLGDRLDLRTDDLSASLRVGGKSPVGVVPNTSPSQPMDV